MKSRKARIALIASNVLFAGLCAFLFLRLPHDMFDAKNPARHSISAHMTTAEQLFTSRQPEFERMHEIIAARPMVNISYTNGISLQFIKEKEWVEIPEQQPAFSEADKRAITDFFEGDDSHSLDMLQVSNTGNDVVFQVYSDGPFKIYLVHKPSSNPRTLYPAYETRELPDGWSLMAIDQGMSTEDLFSSYQVWNAAVDD